MRLIAALLLSLTLPLHAERLYVTNERAGTIQVIDTATDKVIAKTATGNRPRGIIVAPDGKRVYVALSWWRDGKHKVSGKEGILALDASTLTTAKLYVAGTDPESVAITPNGQRLYLSNEDAGTASVLDVATAKLRTTLITGTEPEGVAASPDGKWVYITAETSNTITVIDAKQEKVAANILVDPRPRFSVFTKDAKRAWISAEIGGSVSLIDVTKHRVVKRIKLGKLDKPVGLALSPDEKRLYVATGRGNGVVVVDTIAMKPIAWIPAGDRVWGIAITRDGKKVYAANSLSNTISVIDTATNRVVRTIPTDDGPWGLAIR
ncbi:MAG: beta-propeller fold lactonase family protein [Thermoanaerobaculia bacterium]